MIQQKILVSITLFFLAVTPNFSAPDLITIPFRTISKMIVVQGHINGQVGNIVIDTGIPDMLINQRFFNDPEVFSNGASGGFQSLSGESGKGELTLINLQIGEFSANTA